MKLAPVTLEGATIRLEPVTEAHVPDMTVAALSAPEIWTHIPYRVRTAADVERLAAVGLELNRNGAGIAFATRHRATGHLVGGTIIRIVDARVPSVEIGSTWIVPEWQRTRVNTEAKFLQLRHCFEASGIVRVEFKTDVQNSKSRAAIARLGATEEGIFRRHMRREDGTLRDSVYFSIVDSDWPSIKARLESLLSTAQRLL
jgi:RimJ/RimL family protein N-acetyltransferase